jgi:hypothetical protein
MILYSKINNSRRPKFKLITTIELIDNKKIVRKKILSSQAKGFLESFMSKYDLLKQNKPELKIIKPELVDGTIVFDYIEGQTVMYEIEMAARNGREDQVVELINKYNISENFEIDKKGDSLPSGEVFGTHRNNEKNWVRPGLLDLNFDNLIVSGDNLYIFDYEWLWDFALPKDYIFFRAVSNLLFGLKRKGIDISNYYQKFKYIFKDEYIRAELEFQKYVTGTNQTYEEYKTNYFGEIESPITRSFYLEELIKEHKKLNEELNNIINKIRILRRIFQNRFTYPFFIFTKKAYRKIKSLINFKSNI